MTYHIYGLGLSSEVPFPMLPSALQAQVDVRFAIAPERAQHSVDPSLTLMHEGIVRFEDRPLFQCFRGDSQYVLRYADTGDFEIPRHGRDIICRPVPGASMDDIRACLLGPALAVRFHLQGRPVLHASASVIGDRAAAFVDWSGGGKSTTAAAFMQHGCRLLTDDVLVLRESGGAFHVSPGYPILRLQPEAIESLFGWPPDRFPRVRPHREKRSVPVGDAFHSRPCRLAAIYLLGVNQSSDSAEPVAAPVSAGEAVLELVRNTYGARWMEPAIRARQFDDYCRLVSAVPVRTVSFVRDLSHLPKTRAAILDDFRSLEVGTSDRV